MILSLFRRAKSLCLRLKPQSASSRNVLKLAGGTAGSQVITVASAPILTRLYGPQSFGVLATFVSILALLNVVSSLRYELAIAVPEDDDEAVALVWLCFGLVTISTGLTAMGVMLLGDQLVIWLNEPAVKPLLWLLPVGVFLSGVYQALSYWAIRRKQFGLLAQTRFRQSIFGVATNLLAAPLGTIGLLLGQIANQSAGFLAIFHLSKSELFGSLAFPIDPRKILHRYSHFGIFSTPSGFINILGDQIPIIIMVSSYGSESVGQFALALKLLIIPAGLISSSVSQVFLSRSVECFKEGKLKSLAKKTSRRLFLYAVLFSIPILAFAPTYLPLVLGQEWSQSGVIAVILIPLFIGQTTVSSVSTAFFAIQKNRMELFAQTIQSLLKILPITFFILTGFSFEHSLIAYSLGSLAGYISYFILLSKSLSYACD